MGDGGGEQDAPATMLEQALAYAASGKRVFPVDGRKEPILRLVPRWGRGATTDPAVIEDWWGQVQYADIAWAIDADTVAVDADVSHGQSGIADLERLAGVAVDAILTAIAVTPSGGRHVFFRTDGRRYRNGRIPGTAIDIKGGGTAGYVVLPGPGTGRFWLRSLDTPLLSAPTYLDCMLDRRLIPVPRTALERMTMSPAQPSDPWPRRKALIALERACSAIAAAPNGAQGDTRRKQCFYIGGSVAHPLTPDSLALETHFVCQPYGMVREDGGWVERDMALPPQIARMYLAWKGEMGPAAVQWRRHNAAPVGGRLDPHRSRLRRRDRIVVRRDAGHRWPRSGKPEPRRRGGRAPRGPGRVQNLLLR
jgi:hypothetical protein